MGVRSRIEAVKKHASIYVSFFRMYLKSRLIYKVDFALGLMSQLLNLVFSVAFLGLLFTQVESLNGWTFNEILLLAGFSGFVLNLHHVFLFAPYRMGEDYILSGRMDRYLVRPLNVLFQVFARYVSEDNIAKMAANAALIAYAWNRIGLTLTPEKLVYGVFAVVSGVMVIASIFLVFGSTAFWTGRSKAVFWLFFQVSNFRKYPYSIFSGPVGPVKILLVTLIPVAFTSFFPTTFLLGRDGWRLWQLGTLVAGPLLYFLAYRFWLHGLSNYSSTGS